MTPVAFEKAINEACKADTLEAVTTAGFELMETALGMNAVSYLAGIDRLCRRMRQLGYQPSEPRPRMHEMGALL